MRRSLMILVTVVMSLALAPLLGAQIGKRVSIGAGTPEDKALAEINAATDPAQKLALIEKFLTEYGKGDMAVVAYELYIAHYMAAKDYDRAYDYGEKLLGVDPDNFSAGDRKSTRLNSSHVKISYA